MRSSTSFVFVIATLLLTELAVPLTNPDAPDRNTRLVSAAQTSCRTSSDDIEPVWTRELEGFNVGIPVIADDSVYVGVNGNVVHAIDSSTGAIQWSAEVAEGYWPYLPLAVDKNAIYVGGDGLYALDLSSGEELWRFEALGIKGGFPTVVGDIVYIGARDFYAIEAHTGTLLWSIDFRRRIVSQPEVASGVVYLPSGEGSFFALDGESGEEYWRFDVSGSTSPVVQTGIVYFGGSDGYVYALDAATGLELCRFDTGFSVTSSPVVSSNYLYIGSGNGIIYAIDLELAPIG